ncbi:MAG: hypothetical protein HY359_11670 [Candidatus Rokubacteria bacterium]|nr:hypothetical protein [Candidatus Rokubacteria bacterium]
MDTLALKLVLTPALIGTASLAGRRWGPAVSGWLVGLPLTSAPVAFFLALNEGVDFAATAAAGTMAGTISQAAFCVAYGWLAFRGGRLLAVAAGCLAFALATVALERLTLALLPLFLTVVAGLVAALRVMPGGVAGRSPATGPRPRWDIPTRMVVATAFVLLLTGAARGLGPRLTGLLAPFPVYAAILATFAHRLEGPGSAARVLRGLLLGLFAFAGFFLVLAALLPRAGIAPAFAAATGLALALQAASLWALRRADPGAR